MKLPAEIGPAIAAYSAGFGKPIKYAMLASAVAVLGVLLCMVPSLLSNPWFILLSSLYAFLPGFCFFILGILVLVSSIRSVGTNALVFRDGLVVKRWWSKHFYSWDRITEVWNWTGNFPFNSIGIRVQDGKRISICYVQRMKSLEQTVEEETSRRLLPKTLEMYRHSQCISFGRISINQEGIVKGTFTMPWSEITTIYYDKDGWLTIPSDVKRFRMWICVSPNKVFNQLLLGRFLTEIKGLSIWPREIVPSKSQ